MKNKVKQISEDLKSIDIIGLVETWHSASDPPIFDGFSVEHVARKPAGNMRCYGGITVLLSKARFRSYHRIASNSENILWVRLELVRNKWMTLGSVYIAPQNSSYNREETWDVLAEELSRLRRDFTEDVFVVMGDFNAYTGALLEMESVSFREVPDLVPSEYGMPRSSRDMDRRVNCWGRRLLELCSENGLIIGNGRFGTDGGVGEFTCMSGARPSLIDYVLVDSGLAAQSVDVEVLQSVGSDHWPVKLELGLEVEGKRSGIGKRYETVGQEKVRVRKPLKKDWNNKEIDNMNEIIARPEVMDRLEEIRNLDCGAEEVLAELCELVHQWSSKAVERKVKSGDKGYYDEECRRLKQEVETELEIVRQCQDEELRLEALNFYRVKNREYKKLLKRKSREWDSLERKKMMEDFTLGNVKEFWSRMRKERANISGRTPSPESWPGYFENLEGDCEGLEEDSQSSCSGESIFPLQENDYELVGEVTREEVREVVSKMKGGSAPGLDGIPAWVVKKFVSVFLSILVIAFNSIVSTGKWPELWKTSVVIPLFKKGDPSWNDNYRPIALAPVFSKVLEKILDRRLDRWLDKNKIINEEQGGFRKDYSTADRAFVLRALVDKYGTGNSRLYAAFLDLRKAFDNVERVLLVDILRSIGLPSIFVRLVTSMYCGTKAVVKVIDQGFSRVYRNRKGVKQGSALSPRLFSIFINDLVQFLERRWAPTVGLGSKLFSVLLFADDCVLVAKSAHELQILLDLVADYLDLKKLQLNVKKTEIVIFGKRKDEECNGKFMFNGDEIKIVENSKYLGFVFQNNGSWCAHIKESVKRGKAAISTVFRNGTVMGIKSLAMHKRIFLTKIMPVIHYGGELWGMEAAEQLETLQVTYYKRLFGLHRTTHTQFLKGELGLFSLRKHRLVQVVRFWMKIVQVPRGKLIREAYEELLASGRKRSWPFRVKSLLDRLGLSYIWNDGRGPAISQIDIIGIVKQRLEDQEIQTWGNEIERSETLSVYKDVKKVFGQEIYFKFNLPSKYLSYWLQLRANCLPLRWRSKVFERGKGFPASRYTCPICNIEEENLDHFLCRCQGLTDLREGILGKSNFSLRGMLSQTVPSLMCRLCRFVDQALKIRKELL